MKKVENRRKKIIQNIKDDPEGVTIIFGNQKGGASKTTNASLVGYSLANLGLKVLIADLDPQSDATSMLLLTKSNVEGRKKVKIERSIMDGIYDEDLTDLPINIDKNLDLLPAYEDFTEFSKYVNKTKTNDYDAYSVLKPLFEPLQHKYDVILLDTPPSNDEINFNAEFMADFVIISLQTQQWSYNGAIRYLRDFNRLNDTFDLNLDLLGILPSMIHKDNIVDKIILKRVYKSFSQRDIFENQIEMRARLERFPMFGISHNDLYEGRVLAAYRNVTNEMLDKIGSFME